MCKRNILPYLMIVLFLIICPLAQAGSDCDSTESDYARAVQLHDMGDYDEALRHYQCALEEDPDNETLPILIANLHEDIENAGKAWLADTGASTADVLQLPPVATWGQRSRPALNRDFEDLVIVEPGEARSTADIADAMKRTALAWENLGEPVALEQYSASFGFAVQQAEGHYVFASAEHGLTDASGARPYSMQILQGRNYRLKATYWLSISYSNLAKQALAMVLPDQTYSDGSAGSGLPLVTGHVYQGFGHDVIVVLQLYQWVNQMEWLRAESDMLSEEFVAAFDYGSSYRLSVAESSWSASGIIVSSQLPTHQPVDADAGAFAFAAGRSTRHTSVQSFAGGYSGGGLVVKPGVAKTEAIPGGVDKPGDPADEFVRRARMFVKNLDWARARVSFEQALVSDPLRMEIRCELGMVLVELGDDNAALEQFDRVLANDALDACARSNRDALMQRMRDG